MSARVPPSIERGSAQDTDAGEQPPCGARCSRCPDRPTGDVRILTRAASRRGVGFAALDPHPAEELDDRASGPDDVDAHRRERLHGDRPVLPQHAEQDVLGPDGSVPQPHRLSMRALERLLRVLREGEVVAVRCLLLSPPDELLDPRPQIREPDAERHERARADRLGHAGEAEHEVLRADVVVTQAARLLLREHDGPSGPVGQPLEHRSTIGRRTCRQNGRRHLRFCPGVILLTAGIEPSLERLLRA
jgi:hypothetical protein